MTVEYRCTPAWESESGWREALERLILHAGADDVAELGELVVLRLRRAGVILHALRRAVAPRFWVDAGRGALEVRAGQVSSLLQDELGGGRLRLARLR